MKNKKIKLKKLYKGCASIRDYVINQCISQNQGIEVNYNDLIMILPPKDLKRGMQFHQQRFFSKFSDKQYQLIDFKFNPIK